MNFQYLHECVLRAYKAYGINAYPIDCIEVMRQHGFRIVKYTDLNPIKRAACMELSKDACLINDTLFYNETSHSRRIAFTIAHELGHYFMKTENEEEADRFASHFLAPRILIHKYGYRTAEQIHDAFGLSYAASNRALASYGKWYREISYSTPREPSAPELQLKRIFFPSETPAQHIRDNDECETEFDPVDKYLYVLRVLKAGLPVPPEYQGVVERYRRMGIRFR